MPKRSTSMQRPTWQHSSDVAVVSIHRGTPSTSARAWFGRMIRPSFGIALLCLAPSTTSAQATQQGAPKNLASRQELELAATDAERVAGASTNKGIKNRKMLEAAALRARLRSGDFHIGDRIVLRVYGDSSLYDTLTVQPGPALEIAGLTRISLDGLLRSELRDRTTAALKQYFRNPDVQVVSLMRLGVIGEAARPGFYMLPFESLLSDVIMMAGGPSATGDLSALSIRRGSATVLSGAAVQRAIADGYTLDQLDLRPGDQIVVPERHQVNWSLLMSLAGTLMAATTLALMMRGQH